LYTHCAPQIAIRFQKTASKESVIKVTIFDDALSPKDFGMSVLLTMAQIMSTTPLAVALGLPLVRIIKLRPPNALLYSVLFEVGYTGEPASKNVDELALPPITSRSHINTRYKADIYSVSI
jgi:hypothetical protein